MAEYLCPLCRGDKHVELARYDVKNIEALYRSKYDIDVSKYFNNEEIILLQCFQCDLQSYYQANCGDDFFYRSLQLTRQYYEADKPEFSFAIDMLSQTGAGSVLEVGCGVGHFLRKVRGACAVAGREMNQTACEVLRKEGIDLDSNDRRYDFVAAFQVLEHVPDAGSFLAELVEKLQPGGHLLLTVPDPESICLREVEFVLDYPPHHMTRWSGRALENIANFLPLQKVAHYHEPLRLEHFRDVLIARRRRIVGTGLFGRVMMRLGDVFDGLYAPFAFPNGIERGHTHGIVFVKTDK